MLIEQSLLQLLYVPSRAISRIRGQLESDIAQIHLAPYSASSADR